MKLSIKFILMFVLLVLSFSMRGEIVNFIVEGDKHSSDVCNSTSEVLEHSAGTSILNESSCCKAYEDNGINTLAFSDIELGFKPLSETNSFSTSQRMRRAIELSGFFKGILWSLCLRDNLLVLDKSKSYHSKESHLAQLGCEYYVFALRRILI